MTVMMLCVVAHQATFIFLWMSLCKQLRIVLYFCNPQHICSYCSCCLSVRFLLVSQLAVVLADYVHQGLLTVVRWPYQNCVRNMGSGRKVVLGAPLNKVFTPPRAIAQTAALASCYSRWETSQGRD